MFVQNWVGHRGFTLESVDIYLPNKITAQSGRILHTWQPFLPRSLEQHWPSRCGFQNVQRVEFGKSAQHPTCVQCAFLKATFVPSLS